MDRWPRMTGAVMIALVLAGSASPTPSLAATTSRVGFRECARADASLNPRHIHVGDGLSASFGVTNCSSHGEHVGIRVRISGPCGFLRRAKLHTGIPAGAGIEAVFPTFKATCRGTYWMTVKVLHRKVLLDRDEARAHVAS